jgi:hypothetical protein
MGENRGIDVARGFEGFFRSHLTGTLAGGGSVE